MEIQKRTELFDNRALVRLIVPLLIEQLLAITIGMADTIMVSSLGEAAVSSISLVDNVNVLLINIISALTTGGAVVASQYLGHGDPEKACDSARQLYHLTFLGAAGLMAICLLFNRGMLGMIFGQVEKDVMDGAVIYMALSALSYPFLAVYNSGAALFRSMGNSKVSMYTSVLMNIVNVGGNALAIYGFHWGIAGAGLASLISRALGAVILTALLFDRKHPIHLKNMLRVSFKWDMVKRILKVGVPNGLENGMFQIGKLLVLNLISSFGTAAIAANAICNTVASFAVLPGISTGLAMTTVVGQCMGAGDGDQAARNIRKLMLVTQGMMLITCLGLSALCGPLAGMFNLSAEAEQMSKEIIFMYGICAFLFWSISFVLPCGLRGAGDARFTMIVSVASMWICRIGLSYLFGGAMGWGLMGVWIAMVVDWLFRDAAFIWRYAKGTWKTMRVI